MKKLSNKERDLVKYDASDVFSDDISDRGLMDILSGNTPEVEDRPKVPYASQEDLLSRGEELNPGIMSFGEPARFPASEGVAEGVASKEDSEGSGEGTQKKAKSALERLNQIRDDYEKKIEGARSEDDKNSFLAALIKTLGQAGAAQSQRNIGMDVGLRPVDFKRSDLNEQRVKEDFKTDLSAIEQEIKGLNQGPSGKDFQYFNTSDGIVKVDKKTGEPELIRESSLNKIREERLTKSTEKRLEQAEEPTSKEVKEISQMDDGLRILDKIDNLFKKTDISKDLGPYASTIESASNLVPGMQPDEDFVKMQQLVGIQLAEYVKSISGAQVSDAEAKRLLRNIPNMTDKPRAFKAKLEQFTEDFKEMRSNYLNNLEKVKEGAKVLEREQAPSKISVRLPDGRMGRIDSDKLESFMQKYPEAQVME